jgi:cytochrome c-type biogenesis protein CcmH/NrfF
MRAQLREEIDKGKNHDEVIQAFIGLYGGQHFLGAPIDKGFNRLAWMFPYAVAGTGVLLLGFVATRWSHRHDSAAPPLAPADPDLEERLDDELRNLD